MRETKVAERFSSPLIVPMKCDKISIRCNKEISFRWHFVNNKLLPQIITNECRIFSRVLVVECFTNIFTHIFNRSVPNKKGSLSRFGLKLINSYRFSREGNCV